MQVTETLNSGLKREIKITVPAGDMEAKLMARLMSVNGEWVTPEEIAEAIAYLASPAARNITGTTLLIDGGTQS